jgi:hypothetical protein
MVRRLRIKRGWSKAKSSRRQRTSKIDVALVGAETVDEGVAPRLQCSSKMARHLRTRKKKQRA